MKRVLSSVLLSLALAFPAFAGEAVSPVVVELFTSQGCSSCPPADEVLANLAEREDVIALSLPVDYWDYLGWKDTLALHGHTERQYGYAKAQAQSMVYTPQMVVNGVLALKGNKREEAEQAIARARADAPLTGEASIAREGDTLVVELSSLPQGVHTVWLLPLTARQEVEIGRGENAGRSIFYVNVPRGWLKLGEAGEGAARFSRKLGSAELKGAEGFAVLVQKAGEKGNGPIVAAAKAMF